MAEPCVLQPDFDARTGPALQGDTISARALVRDLDMEAIDPATVRLRYRQPDFTQAELLYGVDPELTRHAAGDYRATVDLTEPGVWVFRWEVDGTHSGAAELRLPVADSDL